MLIQDIAMDSFEPVMEVSKKAGPISPWRELVHPERTCEDAYIFRAYCICNGTVNTDWRQPKSYDMVRVYGAVERYVNEAIRKVLEKEGKYANCEPQKVDTTTIDMQYIVPSIGQDFMTDHIQISLFLEPAHVRLRTKVVVRHHADSFNVEDEPGRVLDLVCKT